ncbi:MAG: hypothetical protein HW380_1017 [Magnetococcales bacterium]|nr:hypothetical protein [Magnetococcales bacterium]
MFEWITHMINHPGLPWGVSALIVFWGLFALLRFRARVMPLHHELSEALNALAVQKSPASLAHNLNTLDARLAAMTTIAPAWRSYRSTLFLSAKTKTLQSSDAAEKHFHLDGLGQALSELKTFQSTPSHLANTGLVFTFFSLVVAIHVSANGLLSSASGPSYQAIQGLFAIASFKFLTSIAGILCAMMLSTVIRKHLHLLENRLRRIADALDRLVEEVPRETMVLEQISHLNLNADTRQDVLEQLPRLAESMSAQWSADMDQRLSGVIRQITRQGVDLAERIGSPNLSATVTESLQSLFRHHGAATESILNKVLQDTLSPLVEAGLSPPRLDAGETLAELQRLIGEQTIVEPIVRSVREELQRIREEIHPAPSSMDPVITAIRQEIHDLQEALAGQMVQATPFLQNIQDTLGRMEAAADRPSTADTSMQPVLKTLLDEVLKLQGAIQPHPDTIGPIVTSMRQEVQHLQESLTDQIQRSAPEAPVMQNIVATLSRLEEVVQRPPVPDVSVEPLIRTMMDEIFKLRTTLQPPAATVGKEDDTQPHRLEPILEAFGEKLLELQESVRKQGLVEPNLQPVIKLLGEGVERLEQTIRSEQDKTTQLLKNTLEDIQDALTSPVQAVNHTAEPMPNAGGDMTPILQAIQQEQVRVTRQMELMLDAIKERIQTLEEDWRAAIAGLEAEEHVDSQTPQELAAMRRELLAENGRLSGQLESAMAVIHRDLAQAAENRQQAVRELLKDTTGEIVQKLSLDPLMQALARQGERMQVEVERILKELGQEALRLNTSQQHALQTALAGFNQRMGDTLIPSIVETIRENQGGVTERLEGLGRVVHQGRQELETAVRDIKNQSSIITLEPLLHAVRDETGRVAGRMDTLTLALHEENRILGRQVDEIKQTLMTESGRIADQSDEIIRRMGDEGRKTAGQVGEIGRMLKEEQTRTHGQMEKLGEGVTLAIDSLSSRIDTATQITRATMPAVEHLVETLREDNRAVLSGLDGMAQRLRDELALTTTNQHKMLLQLFGDVSSADSSKQTLEPLLKTLDEMNGGLHLRMEEMLSSLRTETDRLSQAQQHILAISERANQAVADGFGRQPAWEETLNGLNEKLGRQIETVLEVIHREGEEITTAQKDLLEQHLQKLPRQEDLQAAITPLRQALEGENTRVMAYLDNLKQAVGDEARFIGAGHLEALRAALHEGFERDGKTFDLGPVIETIQHRTADQLQRSDLEATARFFIESLETQAGRVVEQLDRAIQSATPPVLQAVETEARRVMEHVGNTNQSILHAVETQAWRVMEHVGNANQPILHAVETQAGRIMEHVGNANQPILHAVETQAGQVITHVDQIKDSLLEETRQAHGNHLEAVKNGIYEGIERRESVFTLDPALESIHHHAEAQKHRINELETLIRRQRIEESETRREDLSQIVHSAVEVLAKRDELLQALAAIKEHNIALTRKQTDLIISIQEESGHLSERFQEMFAGLHQELLRATDREDLSEAVVATMMEEAKTLESLVYAQRMANREAGLRLDVTGDGRTFPTNIWNQARSPQDVADRVTKGTPTAVATIKGVDLPSPSPKSRTKAKVVAPIHPTPAIAPPLPEERENSETVVADAARISLPMVPSEAVTPGDTISPWTEAIPREQDNNPTVAAVAVESTPWSETARDAPQPLTAILQDIHRLPWAPHRQKHQDFAGRREAAMNGVVNRIARAVFEKTAGSAEPVTPILNRMSDLLADGQKLADSQFASYLSDLVQTMETWTPGPNLPQDTLSGLDDDIIELAGLIQEGVDEKIEVQKPVMVESAKLQRRTIKPLIPLTRSPFPAEILATAILPSPPLLGGGHAEPLDSLLHRYYDHGKGGA